MGKVFINYRRDDDPSAAARVRDGLAAKFGKSNIFMDVDNLLAGQRFDEELAKALSACDILIAIIGPRWMGLLSERAASGERDYVREEISEALKRKIVVIPVRVGREGQIPPLPRPDELPEDIRDLVLYQKHDVTHERFGRDIADLTDAITTVRRAKRTPRPWGKIAATSLVLLSLLGGGGDVGWQVYERARIANENADAARREAERKAREEALRKELADAKKRADEAEKKRLAMLKAQEEAKKKAEEERKAREAAAAEAKRKEEQRLAMRAEEERKRKEAEVLTHPGRVFRDCEDVCPEMVVVPAGKFLMGSPKNEEGRYDDEGPQRTVTIAKPFAVGKFEVTRDEFKAFVKATGHKVGETCWTFEGNKSKKRSGRSYLNPGYMQKATHPVVCVNWDDANAYATWLSSKSGKSYRLLTEGEWEYAARAGTTTRFSYGETDQQCSYANGADQTAKASGLPKDWTYAGCKDGYDRTAPVGSFKPNAFGFYDMHGNAWEWVEDCSKDSYTDAPSDGTASTSGDCSRRVVRGGSWNYSPDYLRSALRGRDSTDLRGNWLGFRVGRALTP